MTADYQKKLFIKNYGCQMNVYDAERMQDVLAGHGFVAGASADDADLILLNTCHIREKATEKIFSELGRLNILKKQRFDRDGVNVMIGVVGCVAQAEGEYILERAPIVDLVIGPQAYHRLPELLQIAARDGQALATDFAVADKFDYLAMSENSIKNNNYPDAGKIKAVSSFVSVQEGCDKFCTFCVVPYTRGAEFSRPLEQIVNEVKMLLDRGVCEFTLLGQNVNAYHGTNSAGTTLSLGDLLYELAELPGVRRLRYTTSHPRDMDDQLINAHRDIKQLMPFLHLPVQSGSDKILKAMNRRHDVDLYHDVIARVRRACPDIAVSGDFIVGFPGETDADFAATMELVGKINYAQAYSFKYSARPGTPAADRDDQVPEAVKSMRLSQLQNLLRQQQLEFNQKMLGQTLPDNQIYQQQQSR